MSVHFRLIGDVHGNLESYLKVAQESPVSFQVGDLGFNYDPLAILDHTKHVFIGGNHDNYDLELTDLAIDDPLVFDSRNPYTIVGYGRHNHAEHHAGYMQEVNDDPRVYRFSKMPKHFLGNYGVWDIPGAVSKKLRNQIFFVRGAWSIDGRYRRENNWSWWPREQLSEAECTDALELYEKEKPDFVVTHCTPKSILPKLTLSFSDGKPIPTQTGHLLDLMFKIHKPKYWIFGHYHQEFNEVVDGTHFICLSQFPYRGWTVDFDEELNLLGFDKYSVKGWRLSVNSH